MTRNFLLCAAERATNACMTSPESPMCAGLAESLSKSHTIQYRAQNITIRYEQETEKTPKIGKHFISLGKDKQGTSVK